MRQPGHAPGTRRIGTGEPLPPITASTASHDPTASWMTSTKSRPRGDGIDIHEYVVAPEMLTQPII